MRVFFFSLFFLLNLKFLFPLQLNATNLKPKTTGVTSNSASFIWDLNPGSNYNAVLSTNSDFNTIVSTGLTNTNTTTYINLTPNTSYYFKVKISTDNDTYYSVANPTATLANLPINPIFIDEFFKSDSTDTAIAVLFWDKNGNPDYTDYTIEASTSPLPNTNPGNLKKMWASTPYEFPGLFANTTYYFRIKAVNLAGTETDYTIPISTSTLALKLSTQVFVHETSTTFKWTPVNGAAMHESCQGYRIIITTVPLFEGEQTVWETSDNSVSNTQISGLWTNTTYYYKIGSLNWHKAPNFLSGQLTTFTNKPQNLQVISITSTTARLGWTAFPVTPATSSALGYMLEASTTNFNGTGTVFSSTTYNLSMSTLTLTEILPNTTHYFRVSALNFSFVPNYSSTVSSITLSKPLTLELINTIASTTSITVSYNTFPLTPQSATCEGYRLDISSYANFLVYFSSITYSAQTNKLTITGLWPNTTYYLKIATLNWDMTPNWTVLSSTRTGLPPPIQPISIQEVWTSSVTVSFSSIACNGYVIQASTDGHFQYIVASNFVSDFSVSSMSVTGLDPNTIHYFRMGPVFNGATVYAKTEPDNRSTLSLPVSPQIYEVSYTSITINWSPLAQSPQKDTAEGYVLESSMDPGFGSILDSSSTVNIQINKLSISNLIPNTSYYFRVGTVNWDNVKNYAVVGVTSTLANPVIQQDYTNQTTTQMTINWSNNYNPLDTIYKIEISSNSNFSFPVFSSNTYNNFATFINLIPNTTYYTRATSINRLNVPTGPIDFSPMATLAYDAVYADYSNIGISSVTLNWSSGPPTGPWNPSETYYTAQISSSPLFLKPVFSSTTQSLSATFYDLIPNTSYYLRVSALNHTGVGTPWTLLGTALTYPTTPQILPKDETFTDLLLDSFVLHWQNNLNSIYTIYNVEISTTEDFSVLASSSSTTGLSMQFKNLQIDTTYWARIQAEGMSGIKTDFVVAGSTRTLLYNQQTSFNDKDNTIILQSSYGNIVVYIPAGAIGTSTKVRIEPATTFMPPVSAVATLKPTNIGIIITLSHPTLIFKPINLTIPYKMSQLPPGTDRSRLVIARYDETDNVWVPLPSVSDIKNNKVTAQTWHFSTFQIMESSPPDDLNDIKVFPNPYTPSSIAGDLNFQNLPPYSKIKIYTLLGELIKDKEADATGCATWNGKNDSGREVASGVYFILIQTKDKKKKKIIKVAVEK